MSKYNPQTNGYCCDRCGEPATVNYQKVWAAYPVSKDGEFGEARVEWGWEEDENLFFCAKHEEEWV